MNRRGEFRIVEICVVLFCIGLLIIFCGILSIKDAIDYQYEQVIVESGDTFWKYFEEGYYSGMSYSEALYEFKKDNNTDKSSLQAGQTILLRKEVVK